MVHEVDEEVHDGVSEEKHGIDISEVDFAREEQEEPKSHGYEDGSCQVSVFQLVVLGFLGLQRHYQSFLYQAHVDSDIYFNLILPSSSGGSPSSFNGPVYPLCCCWLLIYSGVCWGLNAVTPALLGTPKLYCSSALKSLPNGFVNPFFCFTAFFFVSFIIFE